ncbi:MAG: BMP family ABC transporter substrate-binding protein [Clostridiales bacterium]|nr:BMP family ABC transporter substrate-binding protein [Clostridiales bacterium]
MKKTLSIILSLMLVVALLAGCSGGKTSEEPTATPTPEPTVEFGDNTDFKVGMVTDAGTIDDKSFNQGTWEGILLATDDFGLENKYLKPDGTTQAEYLTEIGNLFDAGYKFIITPGFKFETTIFEAQTKYPDAKFVLIDGYPHVGDWAPVVAENTVSIFFAEHEAGFYAGLATALQLDDGEVGFIGGMEIPPVQKFNWGFQQGIAYANDTYNTTIVMNAENFIYEGSFDNVAAGQQLAAGMFDKGVDAIFCAAGGVGVGAINEAKTRAESGEDVWIIGVDVDQYTDGIYDGTNSIILTSAMKGIDQAAYDMILAETYGTFPGGEILIFDSSNNGVGLPSENPNLSDDVLTKVSKAFDDVVAGTITVTSEQGSLLK